MNPEKLKKLQDQASRARTGGKGTVRRKKKVVHKTAATDDKKLQSNLKKLSVTNIPGIEEVRPVKSLLFRPISRRRRSSIGCVPNFHNAPVNHPPAQNAAEGLCNGARL